VVLLQETQDTYHGTRTNNDVIIATTITVINITFIALVALITLDALGTIAIIIIYYQGAYSLDQRHEASDHPFVAQSLATYLSARH